MKKAKIILLLFIFFIIYIYVANITLMPESIIVIQGEKINLNDLWGINVEKENTNPNIKYDKKMGFIQASNNAEVSNTLEVGKINLKYNLFNSIPLKEVSLYVIPKEKVIPLGNAIGLKLYTKGVLVVGMTEIEGKKPYENTGIKEGDRIISINNKEISSTEDLIEIVNKFQGKEINIKYIRNDIEQTTSIIPIKTEENEYKLGLWVRDAAAGVGTASFYVPSNGMFASLGHGITDIDTEELITISNGELVTTNISSIQKGEKGKPGEIRGSIEGSSKIGNVYKNTSFGIFGKVTNISKLNISEKEMEILTRNEIKIGKAQIICELERGKKQYYDIEIKRVYINNNKDNKSFLIKITDEELLEKTGGIIQRNVRITNNTKWKICRCSNTCVSK